MNIQSFWAKNREQHPLWMLLPAVLFKIAHNYETSMALVTFCFGSIFGMMMAEYCLMQQIKTFGEALRNEYVNAQDECQRYGTNHSVFDQLAPTFSRDDLRALKSGTTESGLRNIVMRWKRDGWIVPVDRHHWQKTSQCPIVPTSH